MSRRLFWKLCFIIATGTIALFYAISMLTSQAEEGMSYLSSADRAQLYAWGETAESLYNRGDMDALAQFLQQLQTAENTYVAVVQTRMQGVAGSSVDPSIEDGVLLGRDIDWKIHLYFSDLPIMEVTFADQATRFLIQLPERMRPGAYADYINNALQILLPMLLLVPLTLAVYQHIMSPLRQLQRATRKFSSGDFEARASAALGNRNDELAELAQTFDQMADRTSDLIESQRQLISDLSHELRTPLTRLDMAIAALEQAPNEHKNLARIQRESRHIRKLVEDTLTLAWLENERPTLCSENSESLDLIDLLDVLISDAQFEFPDRCIRIQLPERAEIHNSNHRAVGQALENVLRNALRHTPENTQVAVELIQDSTRMLIRVIDQGTGVPEVYLDQIFNPFFRVDSSRKREGFGLGLALAKRHLASVGATIRAQNHTTGGLVMEIGLPISG